MQRSGQYHAAELPVSQGSERYASRVTELASAPVNTASVNCERLQQQTHWPFETYYSRRYNKAGGTGIRVVGNGIAGRDTGACDAR